MIIRDVKELSNLKGQLSEELLNNRAYSQAIEYEIYRMLEDYGSVDITISEDGRTINCKSDGKITRSNISKNELSGVQYSLNQNGMLNKTKTYGVLYDGDQYYRDRTDRPFFNVSAVLSTFYQHSVYNQDGIELSFSDYSKPAWPLTGVFYDNTPEFKTQLFGVHMPQSWNLNGPVNPRYASGAFVHGTIRDSDFPGIATVYSYELQGFEPFPTNRRSFLAEIHGEYPERIRVDEWGKFATFEDGQWKVYDPYGAYEGKTIEEIMADKVREYKVILESSKTREYNNPEYEVLKGMVDRSIEIENGRSSMGR